MRTRSLSRLLLVSAIPALLFAAVSAPSAEASTAPMLSQAVQTKLCASNSDPNCAQTLTGSIPAGTGVSVTCYQGSDYYIDVLAHQNQEGYVPESDVSQAPSGLGDCDTSKNPAIWAAADAIGYLGTDTDPGLCLTFVVDAWRSAGVELPGSDDPITWWSSYAGNYTHATSGSRIDTPPRGRWCFGAPIPIAPTATLRSAWATAG